MNFSIRFKKGINYLLCLCMISFTISCSSQTPIIQPLPQTVQPIDKPENRTIPQFVEDTSTPQVCPTCPLDQADIVMPSDGFGIMGDSFYDEYQADDNRGGGYHTHAFNLVEILVRTRYINLGPWGRRPEPRRSGYAYNWARSGATSQSMIEQGQHTGLAEQVRNGEVSYVWIGIGANDFNPYFQTSYQGIYEGTITNRELRDIINNAISNVTLAVETVQDADAKGIVVTYFTQWDLDPLLAQTYPNASGRKRVADAIDEVNQGIQNMANEKNIYAFNQNAVGLEMLKGLQENRYLPIGDERIDFAQVGDAPQYSRLADKQHLGTAISGLSANWYFISTFNQQFGMDIKPLTDEEILLISGFMEQ